MARGAAQPDDAASPPRFRVLGPLTVLGPAPADGAPPKPVELGSPKQRAVLAMLLINRGRVVPVDHLVDAVWPDDAPPSATSSLQAYISNLRRALRDDHGGVSPIAWRSAGYVLDVAPEHLDLTRFLADAATTRRAIADEQWAQVASAASAALAHWRGPLLTDLVQDRWVQAEADRLGEVLSEVLEHHVMALLATGDVNAAVVQAQELRAGAPLRERANWLLAITLYRAGRAPEALDLLREHATRLDEELGLEPGAELRELQVSILRQDPALAAWPRSPGWQAFDLHRPKAEAAVADVAPAEEESEDALVGRDREIAALDRVLSDARAGSPAWLVLTGPAGIGKSRLAEELVDRARAMGGHAAWARCPEEDGSPAWWPIRQLVRALGSEPDEVLAPPPDADADAARFAVYDRVLQCVEQAAQRQSPLTIVVDDIQWADPISARCLAYLAGALRERPVCVALTLRDGEDETDVRPLLTALARADGHQQVAVGPLAEGAVRELADRVAAAPLAVDEAGILFHRTGGNPLFVREYARLAPGARSGRGIPLAVRSVLGRRLDGLDPAVLGVLRAAAVIGDVIDLDLASRGAGLGVDEAADLLDAAADDHIVVADPGTGAYAFGHGLLREEVLIQTPSAQRQRLHARVAATVQERGGSPVQLAQHLIAALPLVDAASALEACRAAALDAAGQFSAETAADWWREALRVYDLLPAGKRDPALRDDLRLARMEALALAGRRQEVVDVLEEGLVDAAREQRIDSVGRLAATLLRATAAWPAVSSGSDYGPLRNRMAELQPLLESRPAAHARMLAARGVVAAYEEDPAVPDSLTGAALTIAEQLGDEEVFADALLGRIVTFSGIPAHRRAQLQLIERLGAVPHEQSRIDAIVGRSVASISRMQLGDVEGAAADVRQGVADAEVLRLPVARVQLRWMQGSLAEWRGDFAEALRQFEIAREVHGQTQLHSLGSVDLAWNMLARERGTLGDLDGPGAIEADAWRAAIASANGDRATAAELAASWPIPRSFAWHTLGHATLVAHVAADVGAERTAAALLDLLEPYESCIATIGHIGTVGIVGLATARIRHALGQTAEAEAALTAATALARETDGLPTLLRCRAHAVELGLGEWSGSSEASRRAALEAIAAEASEHRIGGAEQLAAQLLAR